MNKHHSYDVESEVLLLSVDATDGHLCRQQTATISTNGDNTSQFGNSVVIQEFHYRHDGEPLYLSLNKSAMDTLCDVWIAKTRQQPAPASNDCSDCLTGCETHGGSFRCAKHI